MDHKSLDKKLDELYTKAISFWEDDINFHRREIEWCNKTIKWCKEMTHLFGDKNGEYKALRRRSEKDRSKEKKMLSESTLRLAQLKASRSSL